MTKSLILATAATLALAACGSSEPAEPAEVEDTLADAPFEDEVILDETALAADPATPVSVTITGVQPGAGPLLVALQTEGEFGQAAGAYTQTAAADAETVTVTFDNVEAGAYAAAVVHDTNEDGAIEMGETGPTEGWGLSGAAQAGAPEFGPAIFEVAEGAGGNASVTLTYPAE